jgi:hypothetical protein
MRTDTVLCNEALDTLVQSLGIVDAERFISIIKRDTFDYTEWRRGNLFKGMSIDEIHTAATKHEKREMRD